MLVSTSFKPRVQRGTWKTENNKKSFYQNGVSLRKLVEQNVTEKAQQKLSEHKIRK